MGLNATLDHKLSQRNHPDKAHDVCNLEWVDDRINAMKLDLDKADFLTYSAT